MKKLHSRREYFTFCCVTYYERLIMKIKRGDIFMADLGSAVGSEQKGIRPVIVIQNDIGNKRSGTVIVAAVTSRNKKPLPTHITMKSNCLRKHSTALLEQIRTIDKQRLRNRIGHASETDMIKIDDALRISLDI